MSESDLDRNNVIKLRINYSEEKLKELAQKRRASKVGRLPRVATSFNFQQIIDDAEALEQQRAVDQANSPTSFANNYYHSKENPAFEPNEFDNDLYLNNVNLDSSQSGSQLITKPHNNSTTTTTTRPVFKIGDDCLKIDIESIANSPSDSNSDSQHQNHQHPQPQHDSNNNNFASNEYYNVTSDRKISDDIQLQSRRKRSVHSMTGDVLGKRFSIISTRHNDESGHHEHHKISHVNDASTGGRAADSETNEFEIYITKSNLFDDALSSRI